MPAAPDYPRRPADAVEVLQLLRVRYVPKNTGDARLLLAALNVLGRELAGRPVGFVDHGGAVYWYNPTNTPPPDTTELYLRRGK
jgi:hypothetical protein